MERDEFLHRILALQQQRQLAPVPDGADVQLFDRSPLCTVALARYLNRPVPAPLADEVAWVLREQAYEPEVFSVRPLGSSHRPPRVGSAILRRWSSRRFIKRSTASTASPCSMCRTGRWLSG